MKFKFKIAAAAVALSLAWQTPVLSQSIPGQAMIPMGNCQLNATALGSAVSLSKCVRASFTASVGSSSNLLVVTSVTGIILQGDTLLSGTGITVGNTIVGQVSGTPGGAGTYTISGTNTTSSASVTSGGIPVDPTGRLATMVTLQAETASVRYRDDGGAPTSAIGNIVVYGQNPFLYTGTLGDLQFIEDGGSGLLDVAFYRQ